MQQLQLTFGGHGSDDGHLHLHLGRAGGVGCRDEVRPLVREVSVHDLQGVVRHHQVLLLVHDKLLPVLGPLHLGDRGARGLAQEQGGLAGRREDVRLNHVQSRSCTYVCMYVQ